MPALVGALERFWARKGDLWGMGEAAAQAIRQIVPADPARVFAEKLKAILGHKGRSKSCRV
jgi:hypothetical protein